MIYMKTAIVIGAVFAIIIAGCTKDPSSGKAVSDGSNTWVLGATTINGTNVPTNVTIGVRTRETSN